MRMELCIRMSHTLNVRRFHILCHFIKRCGTMYMLRELVLSVYRICMYVYASIRDIKFVKDVDEIGVA